MSHDWKMAAGGRGPPGGKWEGGAGLVADVATCIWRRALDGHGDLSALVRVRSLVLSIARPREELQSIPNGLLRTTPMNDATTASS